MNILLALKIVACVLIAVDVITTIIALRNPKLSEGNPVMRWLFERFGATPTLVVTHIASGAIVWFYANTPMLAGFVCAVYAWLAYNNIRNIVRLKA